MPLRIEDYAIVGDTHTVALVGRDGSIDWLCLPRFDAGACFAALLGDARHGRWQLAPVGGARQARRRYRDETLILETEFETDDGLVRVVDFMPPRRQQPYVVRIVEGVRGRVPMRMDLDVRFDYGHVVPWRHTVAGACIYTAGPDALVLRTSIATRLEEHTTVAEFTLGPGERASFVLTWYPSWQFPPAAVDAGQMLDDTADYWQQWAARCTYRGEWRDAVFRSLLVLKALTYAPTGGIVAAPTTSLPEQMGGVRNWDYRYCWLRDAMLTVDALVVGGYFAEALAFRAWLRRAIAGDPAQLQIMYGLAGERRLSEFTLDWLPGYEGSAPVRVGNAAAGQLQLDIYGEIMGVARRARDHGHQLGWHVDRDIWQFQRAALDHLETLWAQPDEGIWEVRGPRRHFTHSKVMVWLAFDSAVRDCEEFGLDGPVDRWRRIRDTLHAEVCERAYDAERQTFTQSYGSRALDASLLMLPIVGFLPATDPRMRGTVAAIERELLVDGLLIRYQTETDGTVDGLPAGEGAFLACTFWLVSVYALQGRLAEARALFERLLALRNDVGLLSEEYDTVARRLVGNFPQAFSHLGLINAAVQLTRHADVAANRP